ncbi:MAG: nicotinate-nucleotide adenylyltransferase [Alphaproteobacteria bacterium]|nr:nicotinate-nucleotide adenylyltransferase [Alphaproteobacteria bacterium]
MRHNLPHATQGQTIGLLGGSFDPPHAGHMHISRQALRRFGLDRVWWLVSPGNPLKVDGPADFARRMAACRAIVDHPRIAATDIEARFGTRYTAQTLARLLPLYPGVRFVWLMGADNLAEFHRWEDWRGILASVPVGVLARPGQVVRAGLSPAARSYAPYRLPAGQSAALVHHKAPCWAMVTGPTVDISSTQIRGRGEWVR